MASLNDTFSTLISTLNTRQQEVIKGRFGINSTNEAETLAAIGERYGITRERVRQIEAAALKVLKETLSQHAYFQKMLEAGKKFLKASNGILKREVMLEQMQKASYPISENQLGLVLAATNSFHYRTEDEQFHAMYYLDEAAYQAACQFIDEWAQSLNAQKEAVLGGKYNATFVNFVKLKSIPRSQADRYISLTKLIGTNPYGDQGLNEWPEINPSTIRDRIYLVLKKYGKPMHFQTIAETINSVGFESRMALAPTVHNELIKDGRFVLVGRGMYGLTEHGYVPGTAREVIARILKHKGPMPARQVILAVQSERFIKPNTILVNLQNKNFFKRLSDGSYDVREA